LTLVNCRDNEEDLAIPFFFQQPLTNNAGKNLAFTVLLEGCKDGLTGYSSSYRLCRFYDELAFFMRQRRIYLP
jgi:hypothetical protein